MRRMYNHGFGLVRFGSFSLIFIGFSLLLGMGAPSAKAAAVSITASPSSISAGGTTYVSWSATGVSWCSVYTSTPSNPALRSWEDGTSRSNVPAALTETTTFTIRCDSGTYIESTTVTVTSIAPTPGTPSVALTASPQTINSGESTYINWTTENVSSCNAYYTFAGQPRTFWTDRTTLPYPARFQLTGNATFDITCAGNGQSVSKSITVTVVQPQPVLTLTLSTTTVPSGGYTYVSFTAPGASSCNEYYTYDGGSRTFWTDRMYMDNIRFGPLTSGATFMVSCVFNGQTMTKTASVSVAAPTPTPTTASIADYGAVGDGATDNTQAIQRALNSGASTIYIPSGTFRTKEVFVPDAVSKIYGPGTLKQLVAGQNILMVDHVTGLTVDGVTFVGLTEGGVSASHNTGVDITSSNTITVKNAIFIGFRYEAVHFKASSNVVVENNTITRVWAGILCTGSNNVTIRGNRLSAPLYDEFTIAIALQSTYGHSYGYCRDVLIEGNTIDDYDFAQNIMAHAGERVRIINNTMRNALSGISINPLGSVPGFIDPANDITISGNTYIGSTRNVDELQTSGIYVGGPSFNPVRNVVIDGNTVSNANALSGAPAGNRLAYGGMVFGTANTIEVKNNTLNNNYASGIILNQDGTVTNINIHDNTISGVYSVGGQSIGVAVKSASSGRIENNCITGATESVSVAAGADFAVSNNSCGAPAPTVSIWVSPTTISYGGTTYVSWTAPGMSFCSVYTSTASDPTLRSWEDGLSGTKRPSGGLTENTTFTLRCDYGTEIRSATVVVQ